MLNQEIRTMAKAMMVTYFHMSIHPLRSAKHWVQGCLWMIGGKCPRYSRQEMDDMIRCLEAIYDLQEGMFSELFGDDMSAARLRSLRPAMTDLIRESMKERVSFETYMQRVIEVAVGSAEARSDDERIKVIVAGRLTESSFLN